jgi:transposase InsO family protein
MKAAGLQGRHPTPWKRTTIAGDSPVPAPDLIGRDFTAETANQRWCGDITYVKIWDGWLTWRPSSICTRAPWSAGRSPITCARSWSPLPWIWRWPAGNHLRG